LVKVGCVMMFGLFDYEMGIVEGVAVIRCYVVCCKWLGWVLWVVVRMLLDIGIVLGCG
jgi:hypothetical protein